MTRLARIARVERTARELVLGTPAGAEERERVVAALSRLLDYAAALVEARDAGRELPERYILPDERAHWSGNATAYQEHDVLTVGRYYHKHGNPLTDPVIRAALPDPADTRIVRVWVVLACEPGRIEKREGRPMTWEDWGMEFHGMRMGDARPRKYHRPAPTLPDTAWLPFTKNGG